MPETEIKRPGTALESGPARYGHLFATLKAVLLTCLLLGLYLLSAHR